jgi:putative hydrolase of the HAD superfamily
MLLDDTIDAVLLDAGGVLVLPDPERFRELLGPLGASPDDETCRVAHYAGMRECDRLGAPDWPVIDRVVARAAGVPDDRIEEAIPAINRIYLDEDWIAAPGAAEAMLALEDAGLKLAIVSNASGKMEQMLLDNNICAAIEAPMARVAVVIDSHVVGVEKPDPAIFALALSALGVPPERCLFIGDTVHFDVAGARNAGIEAVHLDPFALCPDTDHEHVASLAELAVDRSSSR